MQDLTICASEIEQPVLEKARCTAYIIHGTMANGEQTRHGVAAYKRQYLGKTVIVYIRHKDGTIGSLVGIYEICDVCPEGNLDIWAEDMEEAQGIMNFLYSEGDAAGRIYYQIIDEVAG